MQTEPESEPSSVPLIPPQVDHDDAISRTIDAFIKSGAAPIFTTQTVSDKQSIDLADMLRLMKAMDDDRWDREIKLLNALEALGAIITFSPYLPGDRMVVTLPESYERAREERERRKARQEQVVEHRTLYSFPNHIFSASLHE